MDDFAVDLDKVLDDFELSEGERAIQHGQHSHMKNDVRLDTACEEQIPVGTRSTEKENNSCVPSFYDIPYDTHKTLDIVDGDFGPKGLGSDLQPNMNTTDGGYFVPEGASDSADDADDHMPGMLNGPVVNMFCYEGQPVGHVGSGLSASSVYDKHRNVDLAPAEFLPDNHVTPELLHNAFDAVGLADPDSDTEPSMRPSFMSSSPPNVMALGGISQPDVVPAMMDAQLNVSLPCCELADDLQLTTAKPCSRDDTVQTSEVSEGARPHTMMAEEANTGSPHSSMVISRSDSDEQEKEVTVTTEEKMTCDDAKEFGDSVNLEDSTVETSGSDTADIIMDIQGAQQTSSGSSVSLPDVSSLGHPVSGNADQSEPMNISVAEKPSPVGFGTIEMDNAGDDKMENCLAEMPVDSTCHKDITDPGKQTTVAENDHVENAPAMSPCSCDAMQNEQDTGSDVAGVKQGADVVEESELLRDTLNGSCVEEPSEKTHNASSLLEAGVGTASVSECLTILSELQDTNGSCDLGETIATQSVTDIVIGTSTVENSSDVLTSSSNDNTAVMSRCDNGNVVSGPVAGLEGNTPTLAVEQEDSTMVMTMVMKERTAECDIEDKTTHLHSAIVTKSETVQDNKADVPSDATLIIGQQVTMQGVGARPKEHVVRRNRPNSLLGLSKPEVGPVAEEKPVGSEKAGVLGGGLMGQPMSEFGDEVMGQPMSGLGGGVMGQPVSEFGGGIISSPMPGLGGGVIIENSHDLINMQLAQQRARSPLEKRQLNLEIRQHHLGSSDMSGPGEILDNKFLDNRSVTDTVSRSDPMPQVCSSEPQSPTLPPPNVRSAKPPCSLDVSSSYSPAPPGGDTATQQGGLPQQRRPCSLTLPPRGDFQPERHSLQDPDTQMVSDSPTATGDHVAPNTATSTTEVIPPSPASGLVAPPSSINPNLPITELGKVAPVWLPDAEAPNCMQCETKFTFTRRRHHCRCCGKVFCSGCCNLKIALAYLEEKEARVCSCCYQDLIRAQVYEKHHGVAAASPRPSPNPNNPCEYCSTVPPLQQAQGHTPVLPPTVMVPVGVLRKQGLQKKGEPKQVIFSDGIRPGGDLTELDAPSSQPQLTVQKATGRKVKKSEKTKQNDKTSPKNSKQQNSNKNRCLIPANGLPPVILPTGVKGDFSLEENPQPETFMPQIRSTEDPSPVAFAINKNLFVMVKIVNLDCCVNRVCLCFSTKGMCTVAQDEVVIILQCLPDEKTVPRDIFVHLFNVYDGAAKGNTVSNMDHSIFTENILGSKDYGGFLYIRPSFQCLHKLLLPQSPYVIGILLQKWEIPWAKVFPVRLMLRLGAEYRYYPCPLISVRDRKPVYGEIGHTIMNLLADFRNYQYQLMCVRGLVVHMEEKKTYINLPRNRYNEVMKVISNSNDYVMAFGANFSQQADSHLVCIQNDDGNYQTQAINIQNKPRKVTGASFVVFNGALKASSGLRAKSSIVEDGLMVQVMAETMSELKQALHAMKEYTIGCGSLQTPEPDEFVVVQWVEDDRNVNVGVKSPIDGKTMDGIQSIRIHSAMDCVGDNRTIRWTEVFFIENEDRGTSRCEPVDLSRLAETLARACCLALVPHLDLLKDAGLTRLALRATIDSERVGYEVGGNGSQLPPFYMNSLDSELIPVIHSAASSNQEGPIVLELIFHIIE